MADVPLQPRRSTNRWTVRLSFAFLAVAIVGILMYPRIREYLDRKAILPQDDPTVDVVMTKERVEAYDSIGLSHLKRERKDPRHIPMNAKKTGADILGRVAKRPIPANEYVTEEHLAPPGTQPGAAASVKEGWGTVTFASTEVEGPLRLLDVGAVIAILATWDAGKGGALGANGLTSMICDEAAVLVPAPVPDPASKTPALPDQITLQMAVLDVLKVTEAMHKAKITLVLLSSQPEPVVPNTPEPKDAIEKAKWLKERKEAEQRRDKWLKDKEDLKRKIREMSQIRPATDYTPYIEIIRKDKSSQQGPSPVEPKAKNVSDPGEEEDK